MIDPEKKMTDAARERIWKNFNQCYITFLTSLPYHIQLDMVKKLNKISFDAWKRTANSMEDSVEWKRSHPWTEMDQAKVYKGLVACVYVAKTMRVDPDLNFLDHFINKFALEELRERTINAPNAAFRLINSMDPVLLKKFLSYNKII
jgi:hypothetical protein